MLCLRGVHSRLKCSHRCGNGESLVSKSKTIYVVGMVIIVGCSAVFTLLTNETLCAAERGREKIRIGVSSKSLGFLDTWVAHEKGFFRKYGLDAEIVAIRPTLVLVAIHSGDLDYSTVSGTVIRAAIKGFPVKLISIGLRSSFHVLVAQPTFKSISQLKGRRSLFRISAQRTKSLAASYFRRGVWIQKRTLSSCPSEARRFDISRWSPDKPTLRRCRCRIRSSPSNRVIVS